MEQEIFENDVTDKGLPPNLRNSSCDLILSKQKPNKKMSRRPKHTFLQRGHTDDQDAHWMMFKITYYQWNVNQSYNMVSFHTSQNNYHQKIRKKINIGKGVKRRGPFYTVGEMHICAASVEDDMEAS